MKQKDESPLSILDGFAGTLDPSTTENVAEEYYDIDNPVMHIKAQDGVDNIDPIDDDVDIDTVGDHGDDNPDGSAGGDQDGDAKTTGDGNTSNVDDSESTQVELLFDAFAESLGWESNDNKPKTIEELINQVGDMVNASAVPEYADDKVRELDEFVANGGKFEDYYKISSEIADYGSLDLEDEAIQKKVVTELFKEKGYSDDQIRKKIERFEDAGILAEEASESVDTLLKIKTQQKEDTLKRQEQLQLEEEASQVKFYQEVNKTLTDLKDIRGIQIPPQDRKALHDYLFKVESDGQTKYQREFSQNLTKNLLESAYFTMKGDALVKSAKNSGETSAIAKLKQNMRSTGIGRSSNGMSNGAATPIWAAVSGALNGNPA